VARSRHGKKIDVVHWTVGAIAVQGLSAGSIGVMVLPAQHLPETLLRTRGELAVALSSQVADGVGVNAIMGLILVPEGTGTTVLWSPFTDGDAPWLWWAAVPLLHTEYVVDVLGTPMTSAARVMIDSKAMRKVRNTELQFVCENLTSFSAGDVDVFGSVRVLAGS